MRIKGKPASVGTKLTKQARIRSTERIEPPIVVSSRVPATKRAEGSVASIALTALQRIGEAPVDSEATFGRRRAGSGADAGDEQTAALARYYPSLSIARALVEAAPMATYDVARFAATVRVPEWAKPLVEQSVLPMELDLGHRLSFDPEPPSNEDPAKLPQSGYIDPRHASGPPYELEAPSDTYGEPDSAAVLRIASTMAEQGAEFEASVEALQGYAGNLSDTLASARLLARACLALSIDPKEIRLGGRPLTAWQPSHVRGGGHTAPSHRGGPGWTSLSNSQLDPREELQPKPAALEKWIAENDPRWMRASKKAFEALDEDHRWDWRWKDALVEGLIAKQQDLIRSDDSEGHQRMLDGLRRLHEIGFDQFGPREWYLKRFPPQLLEDDAFADRLVLFLADCCPNVAREDLELRGKKKLEENAGYHRALTRHHNREYGAAADLVPIRRKPQALQPVGNETYAWRDEDLEGLFGKQKLLHLSDNSIHNSGLSWNIAPFDEWLAAYKRSQRSQVLELLARVVELSQERRSIVGAQSRALAFLAKPVKVPTDDKTIRALARLAAAAGVSPDRIQVEHRGALALLSTFPAAGFVASTEGLEPALEKGALEALFPAGAKQPSFEMQEVLRAAEHLRPEGRFVPIDLAAKKAGEREKLLAGSAGRYHHVGAVAVMAGTLFRGFGQDDVRRVLASLGHTEANQKTWSEVAVRLSELSLESRAFALREVVEGRPDFEFLPARVELADPNEKPHALAKTAAKYTALDGVSLVTALLDRLAAFRDPPQATIEIISRLVKQKKLSIHDVRLCFQDHPLRDWVVQHFADSLRDLAQEGTIESDRVRAALDRALPFEREEKLVSQALTQLHSWELATRPPLDAVEHTRTEPQPVPEPVSPFDVAPKAIDRTGFADVAGIPVRLNTDPLRDRSAIPTAKEASLVMTKTTKKNLARVALALRGREKEEMKKRFVVYLEGPTSTGKTSLARLYAHLTDSPYRRFNGSQDTEVADLLGRWVGGQMKYQRAQLEKLPAEELQHLAEQYGVEGGTRDDQVAQIFDAQRKPKWVDGPLTRAMKRGEIFVLDEAPNIRSGVLTALNSLLDDDGYVVLDEHDDEVVRPHQNFRLVLTGNPASGYQGRERLGKDLLSRLGGVVPCLGMPREELVEILVAKYGEEIPLDHLANLVAVHEAVATAADEGRLGRQTGGVAFTLRNLDRVCHRFIELRGSGVSDELLMRREAQEIYLDGLGDPDDRAVVSAVLQSAMDVPGLDEFYTHLEVKETRETFTIGDVTVKKLDFDHELVPKQNGELLLDQRTKVLLYKIVKMLDLGESPALIGDRSTGKTVLSKYVAQIYGQPFRRALMNGDKDASSLVGRYDGKGWRDGIVLKSGRPGNAPGLLLIDEANKGSSNLLERLNSATDDDRMIVLAEKDGDEVKLDPRFKLLWAMNPPDKRYPGGNKLSKAFTNRVTPLWVTPLETREDVGPIALFAGKRLGLDRAVVESMLDLHYWVKQRYTDNKLGKDLRELDKPDFSLRDVLEALNATADAATFTTVRDAFQKAADLVYVRAPSNADNDAITKRIEDLSTEKQRRVAWRR